MRCPDCSKFVSLEFAEPEVDNIEVDADGNVTGGVRIHRDCADCGNELKEATFDIDVTVEIGEHTGEGHELEIDGEPDVEQIEEGGGRYAKAYFGAKVTFTVKCSCGGLEVDGEYEDKVAASQMDELV